MSTTKSFVIYGEPASKANSRSLVYHRVSGRPMFIKSSKARQYESDFIKQCPTMSPLIEGDVSVTMVVYYRTRRPDLDESVILDCMQGLIYENDRQVKEKHIKWGLDKDNPRAEITVTALSGAVDKAKKSPAKRRGKSTTRSKPS